MIGLDTNVLVRYLTGDDEEQHRAVIAMLENEDHIFFLSEIVLVETSWVLKRSYKWPAAAIAEAFLQLLQIQNLVFEDEVRLRTALQFSSEGADLADELIVARSQQSGCKSFATFDQIVLKNHSGFARPPGEA